MKEYTSPVTIAEPTTGNLTDMVWDNERDFPDSVVFAKRGPNGWTDVTSRQFAEEVRALAADFVASGIQVGDRVGLMSRTRYEWALCDYAIWTAGGVTVPIYETSSAEQVQWILSDSGAIGCFVEAAGHEETVKAVRAELPQLANVWQFDAGALDALVAAGAAVSDEDLAARRTSRGQDDLA